MIALISRMIAQVAAAELRSRFGARAVEVVAAEVVVAEVMGERAEREDAPFR